VTVFSYEFSRHPSYHTRKELLGVRHAEEIPFVFRSPLSPLTKTFDSEDLALSDVMFTFWTEFAHGSDNLIADKGTSKITWPKHNSDTGFEVIHLNEKLNIEKDPHKICQDWNEMPVNSPYPIKFVLKPENVNRLHRFVNYYGIQLLMIGRARPTVVGLIGLALVSVIALLIKKVCLTKSQKVKKQ